MKLKVGQKIRVQRPQDFDPIKIHITHILEGHYEGRALIVYKYYGKHRRWWHEEMDRETRVQFWADTYKNRFK